VLHAGDGLPVLAIPSVYVTTVGARPIAVPNFALASRSSIERREASRTQTRLTFHALSVRR